MEREINRYFVQGFDLNYVGALAGIEDIENVKQKIVIIYCKEIYLKRSIVIVEKTISTIELFCIQVVSRF
ncbi:hypothetical protein ACQKNB_09240 [Lysinibacillus xylanilyticus]|uniref:hypothetical protein n=1 Tax=Lysinibacillus xylanilyticus TaxID=582475 RepID=UPI003CFFF708